MSHDNVSAFRFADSGSRLLTEATMTDSNATRSPALAPVMALAPTGLAPLLPVAPAPLATTPALVVATPLAQPQSQLSYVQQQIQRLLHLEHKLRLHGTNAPTMGGPFVNGPTGLASISLPTVSSSSLSAAIGPLGPSAMVLMAQRQAQQQQQQQQAVQHMQQTIQQLEQRMQQLASNTGSKSKKTRMRKPKSKPTTKRLKVDTHTLTLTRTNGRGKRELEPPPPPTDDKEEKENDDDNDEEKDNDDDDDNDDANVPLPSSPRDDDDADTRDDPSDPMSEIKCKFRELANCRKRKRFKDEFTCPTTFDECWTWMCDKATYSFLRQLAIELDLGFEPTLLMQTIRRRSDVIDLWVDKKDEIQKDDQLTNHIVAAVQKEKLNVEQHRLDVLNLQTNRHVQNIMAYEARYNHVSEVCLNDRSVWISFQPPVLNEPHAEPLSEREKRQKRKREHKRRGKTSSTVDGAESDDTVANVMAVQAYVVQSPTRAPPKVAELRPSTTRYCPFSGYDDGGVARLQLVNDVCLPAHWFYPPVLNTSHMVVPASTELVFYPPEYVRHDYSTKIVNRTRPNAVVCFAARLGPALPISAAPGPAPAAADVAAPANPDAGIVVDDIALESVAFNGAAPSLVKWLSFMPYGEARAIPHTVSNYVCVTLLAAETSRYRTLLAAYDEFSFVCSVPALWKLVLEYALL